MRLKTDWATLIVGRKLTIFGCFVLLCTLGGFPSTSPPGAYICRGELTEGFFAIRVWGLIFIGAYTWRGYDIPVKVNSNYFSTI